MAISAARTVERARALIDRNYGQNLCLAFTYEAAGFPATGLPSGSFDNAVEAYGRLLGPVNPNAAAAPPGAFHWWAAAYKGDPGHVAIATGGGRAISTNAWQTKTGTTYLQGKWRATALIDERTVAELSRGRGRYLGWSRDAFNNHITFASTAGGTGETIMSDWGTATRNLTEDDFKSEGQSTRDDKLSYIEAYGKGNRNKLIQLVAGLLKVNHRLPDNPHKTSGQVQSVGQLVAYTEANTSWLRGAVAKLLERPEAPGTVVNVAVSADELAGALARPEVAAVLANAVLDAAKTRL